MAAVMSPDIGAGAAGAGAAGCYAAECALNTPEATPIAASLGGWADASQVGELAATGANTAHVLFLFLTAVLIILVGVTVWRLATISPEMMETGSVAKPRRWFRRH